MTNMHCAFCDGQLGVVSQETIEHFRPKSKYPTLAYHWDNLFPCCNLCQSIKKERFDEALLKPDDINYAFYDFFTVNYHNGEITPSSHANLAAQTRAHKTIELFGLNTEARKEARKRELRHFSEALVPCIDDYNYRFFLE